MEKRNVDVEKNVSHSNVRRRLFQDEGDNNEQSISSENDKRRISSSENDNIANHLFEEARRNRADAKKRWNFDFEREMPLPGRYEWIKIDLDGNEISNFLELTTRAHDLQEERSDETTKAKLQEK